MKIPQLLLLLTLATNISAQTRLSVQGAGDLYPMAVPELCALNGDRDSAKEIAEVVKKNLELSGYFDVLHPDSYLETPGKCNVKNLTYSDWSVLGVEGLVKGEIESSGGELKLRLYLYDVQIQKFELAKEYSGEVQHLRAIAHRFSNEILKYFTGEFGPFGTKIAFSKRVGRFKELFVMDLDGSNVKQLTDSHGLAMSAAWHPNGQNVIFTNYRRRLPDLFSANIFNGKISQLTSGLQQEIGGRYSKDGNLILLARSVGQKSDLVLLDRRGELVRKLTANYTSIDVSPDWSPDNSKIVYTSNRSGNPQIYTMNRDGSGSTRISYVASRYCTNPAWSPKGDKIAFVCRSENRHHIFVSNPDGTQPFQLTSQGSNEDPSWSPDGRYLVFATTAFNGNYDLALIRIDGSNLTQLYRSRAGSYDPSWSSWTDY